MPFGRHQAGLEPDPGEYLHRRRANVGDAILGADAGMTDIMLQHSRNSMRLARLRQRELS
ncbi:hypothetical protein MPLSOD_410050 [Mesorhizobium sp. SOD10]|nr:hypothetical protein MPLSOD_410050 [Mesorhizobium sp. SOD10]